MQDFYISTQQHQELLSIMAANLGSLQSWLVGEISWLDLIMFYTTSSILFALFTSTKRTVGARLPILFLFVTNAFFERLIYSYMAVLLQNGEVHVVQTELSKYVWWCRKFFVALSLLVLACTTYFYKDMEYENNALLKKIHEQNVSLYGILDTMKSTKNGFSNHSHISVLKEINRRSSFDTNLNNGVKNNIEKNQSYEVSRLEPELNRTREDFLEENITRSPSVNINISREVSESPKLPSIVPSGKLNYISSSRRALTPLVELESNGRYNLRSRQETPDSSI